ncbi:hypothetical protein H105_08895 [Trichophyton soudanense CBS 452.61]|uniref:Uncharacterized protein n=1 Tax=Trichophyton soudanense CBS 452.61 TaxID=1215331 RepID=A0A022XDL1_TRISD|nr:hypothetical protein H105_08895 [Trichophyton soudanense CBS 452.61]EZG00861.1 hypothetical protein H106_08764 [Trichophyton rubrum CBS 735.88]
MSMESANCILKGHAFILPGNQFKVLTTVRDAEFQYEQAVKESLNPVVLQFHIPRSSSVPAKQLFRRIVHCIGFFDFAIDSNTSCVTLIRGSYLLSSLDVPGNIPSKYDISTVSPRIRRASLQFLNAGKIIPSYQRLFSARVFHCQFPVNSRFVTSHKDIQFCDIHMIV